MWMKHKYKEQKVVFASKKMCEIENLADRKIPISQDHKTSNYSTYYTQQWEMIGWQLDVQLDDETELIG